jgi:hypothetical protein
MGEAGVPPLVAIVDGPFNVFEESVSVIEIVYPVLESVVAVTASLETVQAVALGKGVTFAAIDPLVVSEILQVP